MGKYSANAYALLNGFGKKLFYSIWNRNAKIGSGLRLFRGAELTVYRNAHGSVGRKVKIDKDARVVSAAGGKLHLGDHVGIGTDTIVICRDNISIGDHSILAPHVLVYDHDHVFSPEHGVEQREFTTDSITIGSNCWIGAGTILLKGTHIGDNCVIGAGCIIKGEIPAGSKVIQKRETTIF